MDGGDSVSRRAAVRLLFASTLAVSLASCGGGGDSSPVTPAPPAGGPTPPSPTPPSPTPPSPTPPSPTPPSPPPPSPISLTLTAPANLASSLSGTINLAATVGGTVAGVEFQIDGATIGSEDTSAPYGVTLDTSRYAPGQHVIRARARDGAGQLTSWDSATVRIGGTTPGVDAGFTMTTLSTSGLFGTTAFAQAPDGRFFVLQQNGNIRIVKNGTLLTTPFHTFPSNDIDTNGERGLLGIALHPDFASNNLIYIYRTVIAGGARNRISTVVANGDVSTGVESQLPFPVILPLLSSATNHNGGGLHFNPVDGKLYLGVGDNATGSNAPDTAIALGKMLRFNEDGSIPTDGPFYNTSTGVARAIYAYGLRNPFTFAFQPGTGRLHINDVGENTWEEVNVGAPGANYGWPSSEGPDNVTSGITGPLFAYKHSAASPPGSGPGGFFTGSAIVGAAFYPSSGGNFPASYAGNYFFADLVTKFVARYDLTNNAAYAFALLADMPVDMLVGVDKALYVLTRNGITRIGVT